MFRGVVFATVLMALTGPGPDRGATLHLAQTGGSGGAGGNAVSTPVYNCNVPGACPQVNVGGDGGAGGSVNVSPNKPNAPNPVLPPDMRIWDVGRLRLATPANWRPPAVSSPEPQKLSLNGEDWNVALTTAPNRPDSGGMLVLNWANDHARTEPQWVLNASRTAISGLPSTRLDYKIKDKYNDLRGIELIVDDRLGGKIFSIDCRSPPKMWEKVGPVCERIVESVQLNPH